MATVSDHDPRTPLLRALDRYRLRHPAETVTVDRFRRFVAGQRRCFERGLAIGHVTGSAWLVDAGGRRVLLTHHKKLGRWLQLGGHADGDGHVLRVALREAYEESGLDALAPVSRDIFDLDVHRIPARGAEAAHLHYDVRFALRTGSERFVVSDESHALAWVEIAALEAGMTDPSVLRMARKWLARMKIGETDSMRPEVDDMAHDDIPRAAWDALAATISSDDSPVGIDAKKTHILILHHLQQITARLERIEQRLAAGDG